MLAAFTREKNGFRKILYASTSFWFTVLMYLIFLIFVLTNTKFLSMVIFDQDGNADIVLIGAAFIFTSGLFICAKINFDGNWIALTMRL